MVSLLIALTTNMDPRSSCRSFYLLKKTVPKLAYHNVQQNSCSCCSRIQLSYQVCQPLLAALCCSVGNFTSHMAAKNLCAKHLWIICKIQPPWGGLSYQSGYVRLTHPGNLECYKVIFFPALFMLNITQTEKCPKAKAAYAHIAQDCEFSLPSSCIISFHFRRASNSR